MEIENCVIRRQKKCVAIPAGHVLYLRIGLALVGFEGQGECGHGGANLSGLSLSCLRCVMGHGGEGGCPRRGHGLGVAARTQPGRAARHDSGYDDDRDDR